MSVFKNRLTGDLVTAYGVVHDHFAGRADHELITEDRDGVIDTSPQPAVLDEEFAAQSFAALSPGPRGLADQADDEMDHTGDEDLSQGSETDENDDSRSEK